MPLHELTVTPADVSGSALILALNAPAPEPLATLRIPHPDGGELLLGVLGASHVVTVQGADSQFSEQVSCTSHAFGGQLPDQADAPGYHLDARHDEYNQDEFGSIADELRVNCARDQGWLGGTFPGDRDALTAIAAASDGSGWRWRTWHLYPAPTGGTVVYTESRWHPWTP